MNDSRDRLEKTATRGNPSFVWRAGQDRRLSMVQKYTSLEGKRILDVGCGVGMYTLALQRFSPLTVGIEVEFDRAARALESGTSVVQGSGESLPFSTGEFDVVFSHEVIEHVQNDAAMAAEMVRVTRSGGHLAIFCPNRWYPFETHGHYWKGIYHFGNTPLINYLPDPIRNRLAPHVRAYSTRRIRALFDPLPVRVKLLTQIYPGYDNIAARRPRLVHYLRRFTYYLEKTPLRTLGISHLLVLEKAEM